MTTITRLTVILNEYRHIFLLEQQKNIIYSGKIMAIPYNKLESVLKYDKMKTKF